MYIAVHEDALGRRADLAGVLEAGPRYLDRGRSNASDPIHDKSVFAAKLEEGEPKQSS